MGLTKENNLEFKRLIEREGVEKIESVTAYLERLSIEHEIWYHPAIPTIERALEYWGEMPGTHCKNLFFRNHKGKRHYLVLFECHKNLDIASLERRLKEGKLTFASQKRMERYLGVTPGSVTPFGLINDHNREVKLFIDSELKEVEKISFHPNDNRASLLLSYSDFLKFLEERGNEAEYFVI